LFLGISFLGVSYVALKYQAKDRQTKIKDWNDVTLPKLIRKQQSTVIMFYKKAL